MGNLKDISQSGVKIAFESTPNQNFKENTDNCVRELTGECFKGYYMGKQVNYLDIKSEDIRKSFFDK